jgi:hypothetical protein
VKCYIDNSVRLQRYVSGANLVVDGTALGLGIVHPLPWRARGTVRGSLEDSKIGPKTVKASNDLSKPTFSSLEPLVM